MYKTADMIDGVRKQYHSAINFCIFTPQPEHELLIFIESFYGFSIESLADLIRLLEFRSERSNELILLSKLQP